MSPALVHLNPLCIVSPAPSAFDAIMVSNDLASTPPLVLPHSATFWLCPHLFNTLSTTPSPFDVAKVSNNAQTSWDAFLPPLLTRSAAPLPCFTHPPSFDAPTTFLPPLVRFAHPFPVWRCQMTFKRPGTHSSSPTASFDCPSPLFHLPAFI